MFRRIEPDRPSAGTLMFEGREVPFRSGDSVAAALLAAGITHLRNSPIDASLRAPYCLMGICFECLVEIDGRQNQQACLVSAQAGMVIHAQKGARQLAGSAHGS